MTSTQEWLRRFNESKISENYGARDVKNLERLSLSQIGGLASQSGIHPDVLGPLRRAAAKLNWVVMVRPIKTAAMCLVGEFGKLPKPMEVKAKCNAETGMVMLEGPEDLQLALTDGRIDQTYARVNGLRLSEGSENIQGKQLCYLENTHGQRYFSDMDLYEVLDATSGDQVRLGSGCPTLPNEGAEGRAALDEMINILRELGTDFALIQHGPERQWIKHDHAAPQEEAVTAFCPDGTVLIVQPHEIAGFIASIKQRARTSR